MKEVLNVWHRYH